jgi:hypothetical protein
MVKTNLAQHEQHLKLLESSIREICDYLKQAYDRLHEASNLSFKLFLIASDLRETRLEFEKDSQES